MGARGAPLETREGFRTTYVHDDAIKGDFSAPLTFATEKIRGEGARKTRLRLVEFVRYVCSAKGNGGAWHSRTAFVGWVERRRAKFAHGTWCRNVRTLYVVLQKLTKIAQEKNFQNGTGTGGQIKNRRCEICKKQQESHKKRIFAFPPNLRDFPIFLIVFS